MPATRSGIYQLNEGVQVEQVHSCYLCGGLGRVVYERLRDRLFGAPGEWGFLRCDSCGLTWLTPRPVSEDLGKIYARYHTHGAGVPPRPAVARLIDVVLATRFGYSRVSTQRLPRLVGCLAGSVRVIREMAGFEIMYLHASNRGRLLDVGCGAGEFLVRMRNLGWEVQGVEVDPNAARVAREHGLRVFVGQLRQTPVPACSLDVITLNHVIEHVYDPIAMLAECRRLLVKGGKLVILTPNSASLGHWFFSGSWRGLEPPRHIHLLSLRSLRTCAERAGFSVAVLRTTARGARSFWSGSARIKHAGERYSERLLAVGKWLFFILANAACFFRPRSGEELFLVATKEQE